MPGSEAYLTFTRDGREATVVEANGAESGVRALLAHVLDARAKASLACALHPSDPLNRLLGAPDVSAGYRTRPQRFLNVRDLPAVLDAFRHHLERRWAGADGEPGSVTLGIEGDDEAARLAWSDDGVRVERTSDAPDVARDRRGLARLLFGPTESVDDGHPFLGAVAPLPVAIPRVDRV